MPPELLTRAYLSPKCLLLFENRIEVRSWKVILEISARNWFMFEM